MKITYVIPDLTYSGLPRICIDSCNFLCETTEVFLTSLCSHNKDMLPLSSIDHRIQLSCFNKKKGFNLQLMLKVFINLRKIKPDILHTHKIGLLYSVLYIFTHPRLKVFFTFHSLADKDAPFYYRPFYWCLFKFFKVRVIFISRAVQESFVRFYRLNIGQIIYHGVKTALKELPNETVRMEVAEYKKSLSTSVFITLARISEEKKQQLLIEAFNKLIDRGLDVLLLIIGSAEKNKLINELKDLAGPKIYFLGAKDNVEDYLKLADAFCLTSVYEGLSLATIEALAMKVIPICTPVGGVPEVVQDGYNGILSEDCTVESYVKALKRFLAMSEQEKQVMQENAYHTYKERFTIERCGEEYLKLYNAALREEL